MGSHRRQQAPITVHESHHFKQHRVFFIRRLDDAAAHIRGYAPITPSGNVFHYNWKKRALSTEIQNSEGGFLRSMPALCIQKKRTTAPLRAAVPVMLFWFLPLGSVTPFSRGYR
ncbi:MAG: hypothetical protein IJA77_04720 [Clostridia bacterium]|nr:hypothetical protein [Clostridia bacterium]